MLKNISRYQKRVIKVHKVSLEEPLNLKMPITTAADDIYECFFIVFQRK